MVVLAGALNLGIVGVFDINLIQKLDQLTDKIKISKVVYIFIGLAALFFITKRDVYLPFLGDAVYPCDSLKEYFPSDFTEQAKIIVPPNTVVVYWATDSKTNDTGDNEISSLTAYNKYENSGVVRSDEKGEAILKFRKPQGYTVPRNKKLKPHVHYRYCKYSGLLSEVNTIEV